MFIEKIRSDGLAHLSYLLGDANEAAVVDPRRDCEIYAAAAARRGCRITHIFETHRNEDLVSGAPVLAAMTGATVYHGPNPAGEIAYARTVREGAVFQLGALALAVLETPGHTDDSLSLAVYDDDYGGHGHGHGAGADNGRAVAVFTGDALFIGDVGRTDFYPDRAEEVAGLLFDSLEKICALGDQAILLPAHGAGSVCGNNMADREFSTIGYERRFNPMLQIRDRAAFVAHKVAEHHDQPPYFRLMEQLNLSGAAPPFSGLMPPALGADAFSEASRDGVVVDIRGITAYLGAHLPGSLAIPCDMLPAFAGWLLDADADLLLVAGDTRQSEAAQRHLARMGYDRVRGFLAPALTGWAAEARPFCPVPVVDVAEVARRVDQPPEGWVLLDVRSKPEFETGCVTGAVHIYAGDLPRRLGELAGIRALTVMCESGARATVAASVLLANGFTQVDVFLGSMGAWEALEQATVTPEPADSR